MFRSLHIKNFKCLEDTGKMQIYPLTLLVGPNSSGKSSFIQPLLALKQTKENLDLRNPFLADGQYVNLGPYADFIYNHKIKEEFSIGIEFKTRYLFGKEKRRMGDFISLDLTFGLNATKQNVELRRINFSTEPKIFEFVATKMSMKNLYNVSMKYFDKNGQVIDEEYRGMQNTKFYSLLPTTKSFKKKPIIKDLPFFFYIIQDEVESLFNNLFHLKPLRENPKRVYIVSGARPRDVGLSGEMATGLLFLSSRGKSRERKCFNLINTWIDKIGVASKIKFKIYQAGSINQLKFISPYNDLEVNICDIGFGVSQILPIIVQGFFCPRKSTFIIEQPEIHLHPNIQANLGDFFVELVKNHDRRLIIETHSEHLIARIRRRVADGTIDKDMIGIYYFQVDKEKRCNVLKLEINGLGQTINWPEGFFEEDFKEALEISKIISEKSKHNDTKKSEQ